MNRDELRAAFLAATDESAPARDVPLVDVLLGAADQYAAHMVEQYARPHPWPPPRRKRVDEAAAIRRQQQERKPA